MKTYITIPTLIFFLLFMNVLSSYADQKTVADDTSVTVQAPSSAITGDLLYIEDAAPELSAEGRIPVFMIHGWSFEGNPAPPGGGYWAPHVNYLLNDPEMRNYFKPYYVKYWSNAVSVNELAGLFRDEMEWMGLSDKPFILIAHSMGGLIARSFMYEHVFTRGSLAGVACGEQTKLLLTLGTPHHGSPMANSSARNEKLNLLTDFALVALMVSIESFVFNDTPSDKVNRSDLRWDNYDGLMNYSKYPEERNDWLVNLNTQTKYDNKLVCYSATVNGQLVSPPYDNTDKQYKLGAYVQDRIFDFDNDGIVPYQSSTFQGHSVKRIRFFENYNHADIGKGKENEITLFSYEKEDFLNVVPPLVVWPSDEMVYQKYSQPMLIRWNAPSTMAAVNIYFSGDNGATFTKIASDIDASYQSYQWAVPDTNLTQCIIRIAKAGEENLYTQSPAPFTIYHNRLAFIEPAVKGYFAPDKTNSISWSQTGVAPSVTITYSDSKNGVSKVIADSVAARNGTNTYAWAVDQSLPVTDSAVITIELLGMGGLGDAEAYRYSSSPFALLGMPAITLLAPAVESPVDIAGIAGEKLEIGSTCVMRWETEGEIKFLKITLCDSAKNTIQVLRRGSQKPGIHSQGSFSWKVPEKYGDAFYFFCEGGLSEAAITASVYTQNSFRINRSVPITSPVSGADDVDFRPCLTAGMVSGATEYHFEIKDSASGGNDYFQSFSANTPQVCLPSDIEAELSAGTTYELLAWALFDTVPSYASGTSFTVKKVAPLSFSAVAPVTADTIWDDRVEFRWERAVGASGYYFALEHDGELFYSKNLGRADTTLALLLDAEGYADTLFWRVTARNAYGETMISDWFFNKDLLSSPLLKAEKSSFGLTCYPNPVENGATFRFTLPDKPRGQKVNLSVCNMTGQLVATLVDKDLETGTQQVYWDKSNASLPAGIYFSILNVDGKKEIAKITVE